MHTADTLKAISHALVYGYGHTLIAAIQIFYGIKFYYVSKMSTFIHYILVFFLYYTSQDFYHLLYSIADFSLPFPPVIQFYQCGLQRGEGVGGWIM